MVVSLWNWVVLSMPFLLVRAYQSSGYSDLNRDLPMARSYLDRPMAADSSITAFETWRSETASLDGDVFSRMRMCLLMRPCLQQGPLDPNRAVSMVSSHPHRLEVDGSSIYALETCQSKTASLDGDVCLE